MIPYEDLSRVNQSVMDELIAEAVEVIRSGWYVLGNKVSTFEKQFATYLGINHCLGVANGLEAIVLGLKALDLPPGSEVIVPSNTYIATILAVLQAGHKPIMVEPDLVTYNIDPTRIEAAITDKTRAIIVVHLYGKVCEMNPINKICERHGLYLLEDAAQAHGARYKSQMAGTFGAFGCFSFYPTKNLGAIGDAGAVTCQDNKLAAKIKQLRNYGSDIKYYNEVQGHNSRLDELQAGLLSVKLKYLDRLTEHKRGLSQMYFTGLSDRFILPHRHPDFYDVYHIFNIRHPERDRLRQYLLDNAIKTEIHYPVAPHHQKAMKEVFSANSSYPISEEIHRTTLSIPCSYGHTVEDVSYVIDALNNFR